VRNWRSGSHALFGLWKNTACGKYRELTQEECISFTRFTVHNQLQSNQSMKLQKPVREWAKWETAHTSSPHERVAWLQVDVSGIWCLPRTFVCLKDVWIGNYALYEYDICIDLFAWWCDFFSCQQPGSTVWLRNCYPWMTFTVHSESEKP